MQLISPMKKLWAKSGYSIQKCHMSMKLGILSPTSKFNTFSFVKCKFTDQPTMEHISIIIPNTTIEPFQYSGILIDRSINVGANLEDCTQIVKFNTLFG